VSDCNLLTACVDIVQSWWYDSWMNHLCNLQQD